MSNTLDKEPKKFPEENRLSKRKKPIITRGERGLFLPGTAPGPGRPAGSLSITALIKAELEKIPEGQQISYVQAFLKKILHKAIIEGDHSTQKLIWNYIDGLPKGSLDLTTGGEQIQSINYIVPKPKKSKEIEEGDSDEQV